MLRAGSFTSLLGLVALSSQSCIDEPLYLGAGGSGSGGAGPGTMNSTGASASGSSTSGQGGSGGGATVAPTPALCTFFGTLGDERLFDLRPAPNGTDIVAGGDFHGSAAFDPSLVAVGTNDAFLARFNRNFEVQSSRQAGVDGFGEFSSAIVAPSQDRLIGVGTYTGTVGSFTSDGGSPDVFMFDFDEGLMLAAGTPAGDAITSGAVGGERLYIVGDADVPGIDLGTGPMPSSGFIAGFDLDSNIPTFARPLGIDMVAGSGHMVLAAPDGTAWVSLNFGGPGTTAIDCGTGFLVTEAPRQPALLHIAEDGTCLAGRLLPPNIIEDTDLFILDGKPGLSGSFTGELSIDDMGITAGGSEPDAFVLLFDDGLAATSLSSYGGEGAERPNEVIVTPGGSLIIAGEFTGTTILGDLVETSFDDSFDIYLLKMTPDGDILWSTVFRGPGVQAASALSMNGLGDLFLGGYAAGPLDCASPEPAYVGGYDIYMMRFDAGTL
ncbi:MAG: hypothetical protein HOV80_23020 [Polyangiaceae bacterium]|nr:hypothetical protein [Polyangiaceae bacterium]